MNSSHILFKNFLIMYKSALKTQNMSTAQVNRNIGKSKSYLYNFLNNYNHHKYISYNMLAVIGKALGYSNSQVINWVKGMDSIKTIDKSFKIKQHNQTKHQEIKHQHRQLVHPIYQQNGISHKKMHQKQHRIKKAKMKKVRAKQRHEHNYRYHQIGHIIRILHKLTTKNLDDAEDKVFNILLKQPKSDNK